MSSLNGASVLNFGNLPVGQFVPPDSEVGHVEWGIWAMLVWCLWFALPFAVLNPHLETGGRWSWGGGSWGDMGYFTTHVLLYSMCHVLQLGSWVHWHARFVYLQLGASLSWVIMMIIRMCWQNNIVGITQDISTCAIFHDGILR